MHWLAVLPQYQGRGLGKVLLSAVCQRLRALGHTATYLCTANVRERAIQLYFKFGFVPFIENDEQRAAWKALGFRHQDQPLATFSKPASARAPTA